MKIKLESVMDAMKAIIAAGNEKEFKKLAKENKLFIVTNKTVVEEAHKAMIKASVRNRAARMNIATSTESLLPPKDRCEVD